MADQFKNLLIGIFVIAAVAIVIYLLMFLHPSVGNEGKELRVRFTDIDKVNIGTRVTYGGRPVGEVVGIKEVEFGRKGKADSSGRMYLYELILKVDSNVNVFNTDTVSLRTSGLLGERNIEISPMAPEPDEKLHQVDQEVIYAQETGSVEDALKEMKKVAVKFDSALDALADTLYRIKDEQVIEKITETVENVESITASLNKPKELSDIIKNVHSFTKRINVTMDSVDQLLTSCHKTAEQGQGIIERIERGEGTIGRLLTNEELYLRVNSILSKVETVVDDINHYGLLFQSDKGWQRLRARRLNLLQKLSTPQEFRNYFNDEVNQINTSLSRVYMVLNEIGCNPYCYDMLDNCEFSKVFAELMRRVSMLEEEVRLYNTQIVEVKVHETELGSPPACEQMNNECWYPMNDGCWYPQ